MSTQTTHDEKKNDNSVIISSLPTVHGHNNLDIF